MFTYLLVLNQFLHRNMCHQSSGRFPVDPVWNEIVHNIFLLTKGVSIIIIYTIVGTVISKCSPAFIDFDKG